MLALLHPTLALWLLAPPASPEAAAASWPDAGRIAAGGLHTCARMDDGAVRCWGDNSAGQLGDGSQRSRAAPAPALGLGDALTIAAGDRHTCALRRDRSVVCWGSFARPGDPDEGAATSPVAIAGLGPADAIVAGGARACALVGGEAWCWGRAEGGGVSLDARAVAGLRGVDELAVGDRVLCGRRGGEVLCAAGEAGGAAKVAKLRGIADAYAIAAGANHACILRAGPRVTCVGELPGDPARRPRRWTDQVEIDGLEGPLRLMEGGQRHACVALASGEVRCWGAADEGQLGHGLAQPWRGAVTARGVVGPMMMSGGWGHTCLLTHAGEVLCWGRNDALQLGWEPAPAEVPELRPDPASGVDPIAAALRLLRRRSLAPVSPLRIREPAAE